MLRRQLAAALLLALVSAVAAAPAPANAPAQPAMQMEPSLLSANGAAYRLCWFCRGLIQ